MLCVCVCLARRGCLKLILDKLIEAKNAGLLSYLPVKQDRFLRNIMRMSRDFDDLVASFLYQFGLDDAAEGVRSVNGRPCDI